MTYAAAKCWEDEASDLLTSRWQWEQEQATPNEEHSKRVKIDGLDLGKKKSSNMRKDI